MNLALVPLAADSPISIHLWTFLLQTLNVLVVILVLYFLLFKPLGGLMEKRTQFVEGSLAEVKTQREEAERLLAEYQAQLQQAQVEARTIVTQATREAEELARVRKRETEQETQRLLERTKAEIENERKRALASIREEVTGLTLLVAERVIGRELNQEDHQRLVSEMLSDIDERDLKAGEMQ